MTGFDDLSMKIPLILTLFMYVEFIFNAQLCFMVTYQENKHIHIVEDLLTEFTYHQDYLTQFNCLVIS